MSVNKVLIVEGIVNLIITVSKFIVGFKTGSTAILGDALHSLTDMANNVIAYFAMKVAMQPPDQDHPYGHHKFEQLAVFVLATFLVVIAFEITLSAINRFGNPVEHSNIALIIMICVLSLNIALTIWERYWARKLDSDILRADSSHTLSDILTTVAVIIGWQLSARGYPWLDSIFAIIIAGMVFYLAYDLFKRAIPILVDQAVEDQERLVEVINSIHSVDQVKRVRSRVSGSKILADVVVTVDGSLSTESSHKVADAIEELLANDFDIHDTTVHIEPGE